MFFALIGFLVDGKPLGLGLFMLIASILLTVAILILSFRPASVKNNLILLSLFSFSFLLQIVLLQAQIVSHAYGVSFMRALTFLPAVLCPVLICMAEAKIVNGDKPLKPFALPKGNGLLYGPCFVAFGIGLAAVFLNAKGQGAVVLSCLVVLSALLSFGSVNLLKLYYLHKLKKLGLYKESEDLGGVKRNCP